ncbi:MAG: trypsin-like peptidase domain-containing protein [Candidatus Acidiferrum sp.]
MNIQRINSIVVSQGLLVCSRWLGFAVTASGQSLAEVAQRRACTQITETRNGEMEHQQWEALVSSDREFIANCLGMGLYIDEKEVEAGALWDIAVGLNQQGKFEDSVPIATRCVTVKPDAAFCLVALGEALEGLGRPLDARRAYEQAISIGGYDQINASAIKFAGYKLAHIPPDAEPRQAKENEPSTTETKKFGTGFVVSKQGHILTNDHVVAGCKTLATSDGKPLQVLSRNTSSDLALLQGNFAPTSIAIFRTGPAPKLGDAVVAFGFPLPGLLSSEGNVSSGIVSATTGLGNDVRFIQISAPVQPGNSGGPLFDSSGHVIGVVVAKLDALKIAQITGDIPQNVNFAVQWSQVRAFLDEAGVPYQKEISQRASTTSNTAAAASRIAVAIVCTP